MKKIAIILVLGLGLLSFKKKEKTWVAIGDSITYLNDHQSETGDRLTRGYMTLVSEQLPHIKYINQGHNGWTAKGIAEQIEKLNIERADIYTIFLGTNDWWRGLPIGTIDDYSKGPISYFGSMGLIIEKVRVLNPKAKIVLISPMQRGDFVYVNKYTNNAYGSYRAKNEQNLEDFANAVLEIGEKQHLKVVDLFHDSGINLENMVNFKRLKNPNTGEYQNYKYPDYVDIPFNPNTDEYPYPPDAISMTYDGLHPSGLGNMVIAKMLVKTLK
ncbi:SGNH/GDSL hydrolase family protein [Lacihabitans sp. LS3-19]|uniref:SGNH/GDSL hydrolase family protein n=1 Tax=Lacihabitans sp. LS3-19 TaxID=2487335 RepID=UPI0020CC7CA3|nr:SGNH/GDSL hydrolase family protein [Lacihabitans sp. LS3-19]MCP9767196.1 SGNH/GDSL hydrolase family protein [Lacihabitans sp. LS3-19]